MFLIPLAAFISYNLILTVMPALLVAYLTDLLTDLGKYSGFITPLSLL